jgi:predicted DsbA family dithiol-disulfide isomerase
VLTLHYDLTSPAAAVAVLRVQSAVDRGGTARFAGLDVLGLEISVPPTVDQLDELERWRARAVDVGLPMRTPSRRPPTLRAHLLGELAEERGLGASWRTTCLHGYWGDDADLSDDLVLVELARAAGLDPGAVTDRLADRDATAALRGRMTTQRRRGIGGVPVLEVDGVLVGAEVSDAELAELAGA